MTKKPCPFCNDTGFITFCGGDIGGDSADGCRGCEKAECLECEGRKVKNGVRA